MRSPVTPIRTAVANTVRSLATMMPWAFANQRHNFERDYGWPDEVTFAHLFRAVHRNGIARAAADKTSMRVWQNLPEVWESEEPKESQREADIRQRFEDILLWQNVIEADWRAYIGGYAGLVLRFADSKAFNQPVDFVPGGLDGLVSVEPVWAQQLKVSQWDTDESSPTYGKPLMFELRESSDTETKLNPQSSSPRRALLVHPDRVLIWSRDGTVYGRSDLEAGFNDLIDMDKIKGAGGEGFWKTAKGLPVIEVAPEARLSDMAEAMGVPVDKVKDAIDSEVNDFQLGFNKSLMLAGMKATAVNVTLPQPEEFFNNPLRSFASSVSIPVRVLLGNETGERSSTQDEEDFDRMCMARRERLCVPRLRELLNRLKKFKVLPEMAITIGWDSLLDMTPDQKMARAKQMAEINRTTSDPMTGSHPIFVEDEIREEAGFQPLTAEQLSALEDAAEEADDVEPVEDVEK